MNVLSLFDGMSCGQIALKKLGFYVENYFASEIDKYAIKVTQANFPNTIQIGDVTKVSALDLPQIDLLIGGSPCQGFSFAGKQLNFNDPRSALFFEYVRLLKECKPKYFFLENVKMKKEYQDVITQYLGVEPIELNSALVSAQNRKRLYWTNIPGFVMPEDKGILLKHIVHEYEKGFNFIEHLTPNFNINPSDKGMNGNVRSVNSEKSNCLTTNKGEGQKISIPEKMYRVDKEKSNCIIASIGRTTHREYLSKHQGQMVFTDIEKYIVPYEKALDILESEVEKGKIKVYPSKTNNVTTLNPKNQNGSQTYQQDRIYIIHGKMVCLSAELSGRFNVLIEDTDVFGGITPDRIEKRQNGQRFSEGKKFYTLTAQDKRGILIEGYIRKLTPIECERLQTVPDNYTAHVSDSQRYKMLGNGWTVDAVAEFFKHIEQEL